MQAESARQFLQIVEVIPNRSLGPQPPRFGHARRRRKLDLNQWGTAGHPSILPANFATKKKRRAVEVGSRHKPALRCDPLLGRWPRSVQPDFDRTFLVVHDL